MENGRFVVLTGHLNDYPLSDIIGILRHQRKTGRLLIEYPKGPATFFFHEGELVDAQLDNLSGLQAVCVAVAQPPSPFNFNPLIASSRRSIENSLQRVVSELLGCWDENAIQIEVERTLPKPERFAIPAATSADLTAAKEMALLAPPAISQPRQPTNRTILMMAAAGLMMVGLSTVIAVTGGFGSSAQIGPSLSPSLENKNLASLQTTAEPLATASKNQLRKNSRMQTAAAKGKEPAAGEQSQAHEDATTAIKADAKILAEPPVTMLHAGNETIAGAGNKNDKARSEGQSVNVVMQIENGRVLKASIASHKAGMDSYEALALRIARQRRYPSKASGQQTVRVVVTQPN